MVALSDFYSQPTPVQQMSASPADAARDSAPKPATAPMANATAVSWIGVLLALVLLRVVYEMSE